MFRSDLPIGQEASCAIFSTVCLMINFSFYFQDILDGKYKKIDDAAAEVTRTFIFVISYTQRLFRSSKKNRQHVVFVERYQGHRI